MSNQFILRKKVKPELLMGSNIYVYYKTIGLSVETFDHQVQLLMKIEGIIFTMNIRLISVCGS